MTDNVHTLGVITSLDLTPERVLDGAMKRGLTGVVVLGYEADGNEFFSSSYADGPEVLWLLERLKLALLNAPDDVPERKSTPDGVDATVLPFAPGGA